MKEENKLKLTISTEEKEILELFSELPQETKYRILEQFTYSEVIGQAEKQLKGETDLWGFDTSGWRDGSRVREEIQKITGIEEEFKKDMESKLKNVTHYRDHYKKYYDWYFKVYHNEEAYEVVKRTVGIIN